MNCEIWNARYIIQDSHSCIDGLMFSYAAFIIQSDARWNFSASSASSTIPSELIATARAVGWPNLAVSSTTNPALFFLNYILCQFSRHSIYCGSRNLWIYIRALGMWINYNLEIYLMYREVHGSNPCIPFRHHLKWSKWFFFVVLDGWMIFILFPFSLITAQ